MAYSVTINGNSYSSGQSEMEIGGSALDSEASGRDQAGYMHRDVIRTDIHSVPFMFTNLERGQAKLIKAELMQPEVVISYFDVDGQITKTGYVSAVTRRLKLYLGVEENESFWDLRFTFVEA